MEGGGERSEGGVKEGKERRRYREERREEGGERSEGGGRGWR